MEYGSACSILTRSKLVVLVIVEVDPKSLVLRRGEYAIPVGLSRRIILSLPVGEGKILSSSSSLYYLLHFNLETLVEDQQHHQKLKLQLLTIIIKKPKYIILLLFILFFYYYPTK